MPRRTEGPAMGRRYLGNWLKMEVHDLDNEQTGANRCQIDEIIEAGHQVIFEPDTLDQAHREGYDNCHYCIGRSAW
jgi:hypothetical protein